MIRRPSTFFFVAAVLLLRESHLVGDDSARIAAREYSVDARLFSIIPKQGIDSYRDYGGGAGGGRRVTLGLRADDERQFSVTVISIQQSQKFVATVRVEPKSSDKGTKALEREFDLSDLQPQNVEIAHNDDGRAYRLQLLPRINEFPKPRAFDVSELQLDRWSFPNCPVILNDQDYVGRMSMSSGQLAYIDVPGLAKIEFALVPFRSAKPLGSLQNGIVTIDHESGTSLKISDVRNGVHRETLAGGPYQVFVRWSEPSMSVSEYRKVLEKTTAELKKQIENGDLPNGQNALERLNRAMASDRVMIMSNGLGPIPSGDRIESK